MGYSSIQKGYKLLDCTTKQFFICRDVIFKEHLFPIAPLNSTTSYDRGSTPLDHADIVMNECDQQQYYHEQQYIHEMHETTECEVHEDTSVNADMNDNIDVVEATHEVENEDVYNVAHEEVVHKEVSVLDPRRSERTTRSKKIWKNYKTSNMAWGICH